MIGWWVIVSGPVPGERNTEPLASWEAGVHGLRWLDELVAKGEAREHSLRGGYPNLYTAPARHLLPLFQNGQPLSSGIDVQTVDEAMGETQTVRGDRNWNVTLHPERIAACPPDRELTIEVWDQS